jgi:hypothetical protein
MGKRSDFKRVERDFYPTPLAAVVPLIDHLPTWAAYWEPCAGDFALCGHLDELTESRLVCTDAMDIVPKDNGVTVGDALKTSVPANSDFIITNPPWDRKILHPMIEHFSSMRPTWLLFDADWMHTKQSAPFMKYCNKIVSVGRVKWIPDSKMTGKDSCAWYLFDRTYEGLSSRTEFYGRVA